MSKILMAMCSAVLAAVCAWAEPTITDVKAQQRYPWNGLVDIVVTLEASAEEVSETECSFAATNSATGAVIPVTSITRKGTGTGSGTTWMRCFVWDAAKDVGEVTIDDVTLTVEARAKGLGGVQLWENGPCWAECNVGATKPEEYGYYFWWGDTVGYKRNADNDGWISVKDGTAFLFDADHCPTCGKDNAQLQSAGYIDSTGNLVSTHDAAAAHLGAPWRVPTDAEFDALIRNCDTTWTTRGGVYGRLVAGRGAYAAKSIFLPAAGYGYASYLYGSDTEGEYWSSTPDSYTSNGARNIFFGSSYFRRDDYYRRCGQSVRPLRGFSNGEMSDGQMGVGVTTHLKLDCQTGTRTAAVTEMLTYSTEWSDAGAGAVAVVAVDGVALSEASGSGTIRWTPVLPGMEHTLTHTVLVGGEPVGETLTATFRVSGEERGIIISFVAPNGESSMERAYFATNRPYGRLPLARREGCTFAGWYTSLDGMERVGAFDEVLPDVKTLYARWAEDEAPLYAQWDPNHYSAVFNPDGGTGEMEAQPFIYDQRQALTANAFKKTGYTFKGWATNEAGEVVYADQQVVSNLTAEAGFAVALFAKWEQIMDITEEEIEEWVVYDLAQTYKKPGEKAIDYVKRFKERFGDDYVEAFYAETGKIGQDGTALCVYHDYIAGTDPLDKDSQFTASITFDESGKPVITYDPVLSEAKTALRVYTTYGKTNLTDKDWSVVQPGYEADYRFFKVTIEMRPKN